MAEITRATALVAALTTLVDLQAGPPLAQDAKAWHEAMARAAELLNRSGAQAYHETEARKL